MLCAVIGTLVPGRSRKEAREYTKLYRQWTPPPGYDMKALYFGFDGTVVTLVDIQTSAASYEAGFPWTGWEWRVIPVVEASEMLTIEQKVGAWEDRVLVG
jgi:hypothetical protein